MKKKFPMMNIGTASILTVFVILSMVCFSLLSLMSARRQENIYQAFLKQTEAYQTAQIQAAEEIAAMDEGLHEARKNGTFDAIVGSEKTFHIDCGKDKQLVITVRAKQPDEDNDALYEITAYRQISTKTWENKSSPHLMGTD